MKGAATEWLSLPQDVLLDASRVTCINASEIVIERLESLLHVSANEVWCDVGDYQLKIIGNDFEVILLTASEIHIRGDVQEMKYIKGGKAR